MSIEQLKQAFMDGFQLTRPRAVIHLAVIGFGIYLVYTGDANWFRLFLGYCTIALLTIVREVIAFRQRRHDKNAAANV